MTWYLKLIQGHASHGRYFIFCPQHGLEAAACHSDADRVIAVPERELPRASLCGRGNCHARTIGG